jgi:polar amino acid transport system substrate-binding protein
MNELLRRSPVRALFGAGILTSIALCTGIAFATLSRANTDGSQYPGSTASELLWRGYRQAVLWFDPPGPWERDIGRRGVLRIAVRTRGVASAPGTPPGVAPENYEAALASYLAHQLGVQLRVVELAPGDQDKGLKTGQVDIVLGGAQPRARPSQLQKPPVLHPVTIWDNQSYFEGRGGLLVLPRAGEPPERHIDLASRTVCVDGSGPYRAVVEAAAGAEHVHAFPSSLIAISAFTSNQCDALVEDTAVLKRLMTLDAMKYFSLTHVSIVGDSPAPPLVVSEVPTARQEVASLVTAWKQTGEAHKAVEQRAADILFEVSLLQSGYTCH